MRVEFSMPSTGLAYLPGLARPVTIESGELPADEATELERLIRAAHFFDLPTVVGTPRPDGRQYTITVEDSRRSHAITVNEPVADPDLRALLAYLEAKAKAQRAG